MIVIRLTAVIATFIGRIGGVGGRAAVPCAGVGAARDRARDSHANLVARLLRNTDDVDLTQEVARLLNFLLELLLDRRRDAEFRGRVGNAVEQRDLADRKSTRLNSSH